MKFSFFFILVFFIQIKLLGQQEEVKLVIIDTLSNKGVLSAPFDKSFPVGVYFKEKPTFNFLSVVRVNKKGDTIRCSKREFNQYFHWLKVNYSIDLENELYHGRLSKKNHKSFLENHNIISKDTTNKRNELIRKFGKNENVLRSYIDTLLKYKDIDSVQHEKLKLLGAKIKVRKQMPTLLKIPLDQIKTNKDSTGKYWITFSVFPVEPNKTYQIHYARKASDNEFKLYFKCNKKKCDDQIPEKTSDSVKADVGKVKLSPVDTFCEKYRSLPPYDSVLYVEEHIQDLVDATKNSSQLKALLQKSLPYKHSGDGKNYSNEIKIYGEKLGCLVLSINNLFDIDTASARSYLNGTRALNHNTLEKSADLSDIFRRIENFNTTKKWIAVIIDELKTLKIVYGDVEQPTTLDFLEGFHEVGLSNIFLQFEKFKKFKEFVIDDPSSYEFETGGILTTNIQNFESRSKLQVVPTFGILSYGFQFKYKGTREFWGVSPFLGFQVNFRPIDKDISLKSIRHKSFMHRFSFQGGWLLVALEEPGVREDLFKNSSFTTGLGFKITNALNLTGGIVFFKQIDPNPLVDYTSTAITPYVGLSVDLDIRKYLNDVISLFQ